MKHERIEAITDFFKHHNLPGALLARTAQYVDTMFKVHGGIDDALLEELPVHLKTEILVAAHTYVPIPAPAAAAAAAVCLLSSCPAWQTLCYPVAVASLNLIRPDFT